MKAIIMAAGIGSRLVSVSDNKPKCLIKAGGESLIQRIVRICRDRGVDDITVIVGYKHELIREELGHQVKYVENSVYTKTNSIYSLWLAHAELQGDVLLMNADLYFEETIIDLAIEQTKSVVMLSDSTRIKDADYRFGLIGDQIKLYGKHLTHKETDAEYVGIVKINESFIDSFCHRLKKMISAQKVNSWWEDVLYSFIPEGVPVFHYDVAGTFWTEIDDLKDYQRLQGWMEPKKVKKVLHWITGDQISAIGRIEPCPRPL